MDVEVAGLRRTLAEKDGEILALTNALRDGGAQIVRLETLITPDDIRDELSERDARISSLTREVEEMRQMKSDYQECRAKVSRLEREVRESNEKAERTRTDLQHCRSEVISLRNEPPRVPATPTVSEDWGASGYYPQSGPLVSNGDVRHGTSYRNFAPNSGTTLMECRPVECYQAPACPPGWGGSGPPRTHYGSRPFHCLPNTHLTRTDYSYQPQAYDHSADSRRRMASY